MEDVSRESTASIPVGRYGTPGEYADVVAFLASRCAAYVTGSVIRVDGGLIASIRGAIAALAISGPTAQVYLPSVMTLIRPR
ncbi:MAG: 3-oxoacyl-(acyl-carrier protein) reductase [Herminiimonas sp.]|nr:3-oxoacyl-(acyl-carrier protein) reductase [Herminiimonas sp.]